MGACRSQYPCNRPSGNKRDEEKEEAGGAEDEYIWLKTRVIENSRAKVLLKKGKIEWEMHYSSFTHE